MCLLVHWLPSILLRIPCFVSFYIARVVIFPLIVFPNIPKEKKNNNRPNNAKFYFTSGHFILNIWTANVLCRLSKVMLLKYEQNPQIIHEASAGPKDKIILCQRTRRWKNMPAFKNISVKRDKREFRSVFFFLFSFLFLVISSTGNTTVDQ